MAANVAGERFVRWSGPPSLHRNIFWSYTIFKTVGCNKIDFQNNWLYIRLTSTKYVCYFGKHVSFYGNWLYNGIYAHGNLWRIKRGRSCSDIPIHRCKISPYLGSSASPILSMYFAAQSKMCKRRIFWSTVKFA